MQHNKIPLNGYTQLITFEHTIKNVPMEINDVL